MSNSRRVVFQDTSVLINFHRAGLLPALGALLNGDARWVSTVRTECSRKEVDLELPGLVAASDTILGDPLVPEQDEHLRIRQLRQLMAKPGDHPDEHLGEAETITIISMRRIDALIAMDDRNAIGWANPIPALGTWRLARLCFHAGRISSAQALKIWSSFCAAGGIPPREIATEEKFLAYLEK